MPKLPVICRIREVTSGREVDYLTDVDAKYSDSQRFWWEEGNGSCDCNRKLFFGYAQGIEFTDEETPCTQSAYKVRVTMGEKVILDELND